MILSPEDYMIPCLSKQLLGIDCFGCGMQRSLLLISHGEFIAAFKMYPAIYTLILLIAFLIYTSFYKINNSEKIKITLNVVLVSTGALVHKGQLTGVYTVSQNNTALLRWLRLGRNIGENTEVLSGLNKDESYIISSEGKLYNGVPITIQ